MNVFCWRPRSSVLAAVAPALSALVVAVAAVPASATWSIVGVDEETGQVGVAMASCIPSEILGNRGEVLVPVLLVPGESAGVVQGSVESSRIERARLDLEERMLPTAVIADVLDGDEGAQARQYAAVTLLADDASAAVDQYTGSAVEPVAGQRRGDGVAVQGQLLTGADVLDASLAGYRKAIDAGAGLDDALVAALVAGAEAGGDRRCDDQSALFAHLAVARAVDDPAAPSVLLTVEVDEGDGQNPVLLLAQAHDEGRTGFVDLGRKPARGINRLLVLGVGIALGVGGITLFRIGLGSPDRRRSPD